MSRGFIVNLVLNARRLAPAAKGQLWCERDRAVGTIWSGIHINKGYTRLNVSRGGNHNDVITELVKRKKVIHKIPIWNLIYILSDIPSYALKLCIS